MVKKQYIECDQVQKITGLKFELLRHEDIRQQSHIQVVATKLYRDEQRNPVPFSALDRRLGTSSKEHKCETCGKEVLQCPGHWGYIALKQPVFHWGYFNHVIYILQMICKECSHVLLDEKTKQKYRNMMNANLPYIVKKKNRKEIHIKAKKINKCPNCNAINGVVKKGPGVMKIVHDQFRVNSKKVKEKCMEDLIAEWQEILNLDEEEAKKVAASMATRQLNPRDVFHLLRRIPEADVPLLGVPSSQRPQDLILHSIPVPPIVIRPSVNSDLKSGTTEDDITMIINEISFINEIMARHEASNAKPNMIFEDWEYLQIKAALLINGQLRGIPADKAPQKSKRGFVQRLKGKEGRFRCNLSGKRVDFSGRTVISPSPLLEIDERVTTHNLQWIRSLVAAGGNVHPGANYFNSPAINKRTYLKYGDLKTIAQKVKPGDIVDRHLQDGDIVLFNRQPSLHKLSIMAHRVKVQNTRTFSFNECVCAPYNADFDGDEMNLHVPQTEEARAEALILMGNKSNLLTPRSGELMIAATQDFLTGAYLLTQKDHFLTRAKFCQLINSFLAGKDATLHVDIPPPAIIKPRRMWTGKQVFSVLLKPNKKCPIKCNLRAKGKPYKGTLEEFSVDDSYVVIRNSELLAGALDKNTLGSGGKSNVFYTLLRDWGEDAAIRAMARLSRLASALLMNQGFSIGIADVMPDQQLINTKQDLVTSNIREEVGKACSTINISQMISCVGQQAISGKRVPDGFDHRALPHFPHHSKVPAAKGFVQNSFYTGLTPTEFFFHTMAGREGLVDTAVKTAETGYMQRRLMKGLEDLCVQYDSTVRNCNGMVVQFNYGEDGLDPTFMEGKDQPVEFERVLEHVKAKSPFRNEEPLDAFKIKQYTECMLKNELAACGDFFKNSLKEFMEKVAEKVRIQREWQQLGGRTPLKVELELERLTLGQLVEFLETCREKFLQSKIEPGTAVGALAAQSIGEPGTQMTLKTFHFAGVAAMNITLGVPRILEIMNAAKSMSTPLIRAQLDVKDSEPEARRIKGRIEKTHLEGICRFMEEVILPDEVFIIVRLDLQKIRLLKLELNASIIAYMIDNSKIKIKIKVEVCGPAVLKVIPRGEQGKDVKDPQEILQELGEQLRTVVISSGMSGKELELVIEGSGLRDVLATRGVDWRHTVCNNILEVKDVLGIEAARQTIIKEIRFTMQDYGITLDVRHLMLLADLMTSHGDIHGMTRFGLEKMKESVLMLASYSLTLNTSPNEDTAPQQRSPLLSTLMEET
ncbi:hypothetical protein B566_EDAN001988 [Ephemera danica]|nr:hypothetical protein B566_EDAN001988 [Ephemera danica]